MFLIDDGRIVFRNNQVIVIDEKYNRQKNLNFYLIEIAIGVEHHLD